MGFQQISKYLPLLPCSALPAVLGLVPCHSKLNVFGRAKGRQVWDIRQSRDRYLRPAVAGLLDAVADMAYVHDVQRLSKSSPSQFTASPCRLIIDGSLAPIVSLRKRLRYSARICARGEE